MSTHFMGEGNIGSDPEVRMFPSNGNKPPRGLLRLNIRFDNPVPTEEGNVDRGGFWANVELWDRDVEHWAQLYQKGMRVMVSGRMVLDEWKDGEGNDRSQFKVQAVRIGILPFRIAQVLLMQPQGQQQGSQPQSASVTQASAYAKSAGQDGEWEDPVGPES